MADVAVTRTPTLVLRFADLGIVTYGSLRVVGQPQRTVTWVIEEPFLLTALAALEAALPEPRYSETAVEALDRALRRGAFANRADELGLAYRLGVLLLSAAAWRLLEACAGDTRAVLFVAPSARLARIPWGLLAVPAARPGASEMMRARAAAMTTAGRQPADIPWPTVDSDELTDGRRMLELADVLFAVPVAITAAPRRAVSWHRRAGRPALVILDPRVPGQLPDSALGSVLGRPSADSLLGRHFAPDVGQGAVLPDVGDVVQLFRRADADRAWLAAQLAAGPARLLFVGHAVAGAEAAGGSAVYLAEERPLRAADVTAARLPIPPRVALLACASAGDYRFDEARGLVAAMVLGGAQLVTAVLWSLPTTVGLGRFAPPTPGHRADPMANLVAAVDDAHRQPNAGRAVNDWQRAQLRRWRHGESTANPVHWAALATFAVDGAR
ncbi:CHAT domain-containing protein [Mycolicibacterium palauense]|uniref:CHAT domain-containing protein n=1 Tax=Mycolicibacterium palauense TaxID=2034511 RepID=UPI000BFEE4BF|nr:CHAT domain-containing protein [Mycolicibacterium palauense]